jgi:uncharacterized protein (TIGR02246 family)
MTEIRPHGVAAIKGVLESHYKAWDAGDADAFVTDYAEDATVIMPGIYRKSREEVRQGMAEGFASFLKGSTAIDQLGTIRFLGEKEASISGASRSGRSCWRTATGCSARLTTPRTWSRTRT